MYKNKYIKYKIKYLNTKNQIGGKSKALLEWSNFVASIPNMIIGTEITYQKYLSLPYYFKKLFKQSINNNFVKIYEGVGLLPPIQNGTIMEAYQYRSLPDDIKMFFHELPAEPGHEPNFIYTNDTTKFNKLKKYLQTAPKNLPIGNKISFHTYMSLPSDDLKKLYEIEDYKSFDKNPQYAQFLEFVKIV
jgi:hypothetical protein